MQSKMIKTTTSTAAPMPIITIMDSSDGDRSANNNDKHCDKLNALSKGTLNLGSTWD